MSLQSGRHGESVAHEIIPQSGCRLDRDMHLSVLGHVVVRDTVNVNSCQQGQLRRQLFLFKKRLPKELLFCQILAKICHVVEVRYLMLLAVSMNVRPLMELHGKTNKSE